MENKSDNMYVPKKAYIQAGNTMDSEFFGDNELFFSMLKNLPHTREEYSNLIQIENSLKSKGITINMQICYNKFMFSDKELK